MKKRLGLLLITFTFLLSACRPADTSLEENPTAPDTVTAEQISETKEPSEQEPESSEPGTETAMLPDTSSYTLLSVPSEDITYEMTKVIAPKDNSSFIYDCYITENGFCVIYSVSSDGKKQYQLDYYDCDGNLDHTEYQDETPPLEIPSAGDYRYYDSESYVVKISHSDKTLIPVMDIRASCISQYDDYYTHLVGRVGTDTFLFTTFAHHFTKDVRLFQKVDPENINYAATIGVISHTEDSYGVAQYNRYHPEGKLKIINYLTEGETEEQAFHKLCADIKSGQSPDIVCLDAKFQKRLNQENLLSDLNAEPTLSTEDLFPGVREFLSGNGILYAIPEKISSGGLMVPKEYTAELSGKSFRELTEWNEQNNANLFQGLNLLDLMIMLDMDKYIDINAGTCTLDDDFITNLNYINQTETDNSLYPIMGYDFVNNMIGYSEGQQFFVDDTLDIIGTKDNNSDFIHCGKCLSVPENAPNKTIAFSYLNWYLSGTYHTTDTYDNYYLPATVSGCIKQREFLEQILPGVESTLESNDNSTKKIIDHLNRAQVSELYPYSDIYFTFRDIISEESESLYNGTLTAEQVKEHVKTRMEGYLKNQ